MSYDQQVFDPTADEVHAHLGGFGAEYRELARQRRFRREGEQPLRDLPTSTPAPDGAGTAAALRSARSSEQGHATQRPPAPSRATTPRQTSASPTRPSAPAVAASPPAGRTVVDRMTADPYSMLVELSRMADRVIESRESLAVERTRRERAERDVAAANDRALASRALVLRAQEAAHSAAERAAEYAGRCEALEDALDLALHASLMTRWRWRRRIMRGESPLNPV